MTKSEMDGVTNPAYFYHNFPPTIILVCNAQWTVMPPCFECPVSFGSQITKVKTYSNCMHILKTKNANPCKMKFNYVFLRFTSY